MAVVLRDGVVELGLGGPALVEQRAGAIEIVVGLRLHGLRLGQRRLQHLDLIGPLHVRLGIGKPRLGLGHAGFRRRDRRLLLRALQREDGIAFLDAVALLDGELGDAAPLLRAHQDEVGLHVAGELRVLVGLVGREHENARRQKKGGCEGGGALHLVPPSPPVTCFSCPGALIASMRRSTWVASSASVSR